MADQKNFLEVYLLQVLNENGFEKLDDDAKKTYFPQFMAQAEQRLGSALLPLLNEDSANQFVELTKKNADPDTWFNFWHDHVPNFDEVVKKTLNEFATEIKSAFQI